MSKVSQALVSLRNGYSHTFDHAPFSTGADVGVASQIFAVVMESLPPAVSLGSLLLMAPLTAYCATEISVNRLNTPKEKKGGRRYLTGFLLGVGLSYSIQYGVTHELFKKAEKMLLSSHVKTSASFSQPSIPQHSRLSFRGSLLIHHT